MEAVTQLAEKLGLQPVGWIFTDLIAEDLAKGTVKHFRGNIVSLSSSVDQRKSTVISMFHEINVLFFLL